MQEEIFKKVVELISKENHIPEHDITMDSTFEELNMDSLDGMTLINDLENTYDVTLPNEEVMKITTVRQAVESLEKFLAAKNTNAE